MTVDDVITRFRRRYPDCSTTEALLLFQDSHRRLLSRVPLRNTRVYISLVAGTAEYDLDSSVFKIWSAYYETAANASRSLREKSTAEKDVLNPNWRSYTTNGDPIEYYVTTETVSDSAQNAIGFWPTPVTTTSTYPRVALYVTQWADITGTETIPTNLLTINYYLYDMYAKYTAETDIQQSETWEVKAERELQIENEHVQNIQTKGMTGFVQTSSFMPTRQR